MNEEVAFVNEYCGFYCLSYKHPSRKASMIHRFASLGVPLIVYDGVQHDDPRLSNTNLSEGVRRLWSITYGHLDMIQMFLDSGKEFGFFMENDIVVRKDLIQKLPKIIEQINYGNIEFCLLGCMIVHTLDSWSDVYGPKYTFGGNIIHDPTFPHKMYSYPWNQWGVHLYMMTRAGAENILDTYGYKPEGSYADVNIHNPEKPFSPDWTVSKCPGMNRCLLYPMLAVEDGSDPYEHYGHDAQYNFHMETYRHNFIENEFI